MWKIAAWDELPAFMKNEEVKAYYDSLEKKKLSITLKRLFDVVLAIILMILFLPFFIILAIWIKADSRGPVFFRQTRVTQYGRKFKIFKFRTMVANAEQIGDQITHENDMRITKVGKIIRKIRFDEIPQLINIIFGDMSFVGTRPEVPKYVKKYTPEMYATLLLPAGITSEASIRYKDEDRLMKGAEDIDEVYIKQILPQKMEYNLKMIKNFNFMNEIFIMFRTVLAVVKQK